MTMRWTKEEDRVLMANATDLPPEEIAKLLPRTPKAIKERIDTLRLERFVPDKDAVMEPMDKETISEEFARYLSHLVKKKDISVLEAERFFDSLTWHLQRLPQKVISHRANNWPTTKWLEELSR